MTTTLRRGPHLLALALASTTMLVTAGASAASAGTTTSTLYTGSADAAAVDVVLTLPTTALNAALPNPAELALIRTTGSVTHDGSAPDASTSMANLGSGSLVTTGPLSQLLGPVLTHTVTSTLTTPNPTPYQLGSVPPNALGLALTLTPLTATTTTASHATAANAAVTSGGLGSLSAIAPQLTGPLQTALTGLNGGLSTALAQLTAAIATLTAANPAPLPTTPITIPGVPATPLTPALPATTVTLGDLLGPASDPNSLSAALTNLPGVLASVENDLLNGSVLALDGVSASENVTPAGTGTTSTGAANVATANLFGGLIQVQASMANATAAATGVAGKASSAANATLLSVHVGNDALSNLLTVLATDQGLSATALTGITPLANPALTAATGVANTAIANVLANVTTLLQTLNSNAKILQQGTATHSVSADGKHAEAHATPASISLGVPGAANLVALSLGKVDVVANRENVTTTTAATKPSTTKVSRKVAKPVAPTKKLAYTGADLPLTAGAALVLLGVAAGISRRRRGNPVD